jgi:hypothetical protein
MSKKYFIVLLSTVLVVSAVLLGYMFSQSSTPNPPTSSPFASSPSTPDFSPFLPDLSIGVDELLASPEKIDIDHRQYTLKTYLYRDFMPSTQPDQNYLIASIAINATDSHYFHSSINADRLWVIKSPNEVWETEFTNENLTPPYNYQLEKIARDGPKWEPNTHVAVVVRILHEDDVYLLKASNQTIHRTD